MCPGVFQMSSEKETSQPPWAVCYSALQYLKKFFLMLRWKYWNIYTEKSSIPMALSAEFLLSFTEGNVHQSIVTLQNKPLLFFS